MLKVSRDDIRMVPVCVCFYNIPFKFRDEEGRSQVASKVGKPLYVDKRTETFSRVSFACIVSVKVEAADELPDSFFIQCEGEVCAFFVEYQMLPPACIHCKTCGHEEGFPSYPYK